MTAADWIIVAVLAGSTAIAFAKGFFVEVFSLAGIVVGLMAAAAGYGKLAPALSRWLSWSGLLRETEVSNLLAFLLIVFGVMLGAGLVGRILRGAARQVGLGWMDRLLGALFGLLKGCAAVTLVLLAIAAFLPGTACLQNSRLAPVFLMAAQGGSNLTPAEFGRRVRQGVDRLRETQADWWKPGGISEKRGEQYNYAG